VLAPTVGKHDKKWVRFFHDSKFGKNFNTFKPQGIKMFIILSSHTIFSKLRYMPVLLSISLDFDFMPLLWVMLVAWLVPAGLSALRWQRIPAVIIEIIAGFVIGRLFFQGFSQESMLILDYLAFCGLLFLMFLSGLEIDVDMLKFSLRSVAAGSSSVFQNPFILGTGYYFLSLAFAYGGSVVLDEWIEIGNPWYFSLIITTTSLGVILPVLKNRGEIQSRFGQQMITTAAISDILGILLFTITAFILKNGWKTDIFLVFLLFLLFWVFYIAGKKLKLFLFSRITFQLAHAATQISVRGTMVLILVFVVAAQFLGNEAMLLGAFLSGLLLSVFLHKERSLLMIKLDGMGYGFFIPLFFIMVGVKFDPEPLIGLTWVMILAIFLLLFIVFAAKIISSAIWIRMYRFRRSLAGGFLMTSMLSLLIAGASIGLELGIISNTLNSILIFMAVITCLFSPLMYNLIYPANPLTGEKTVIVGGSSTGILLARRMKLHNRSYVIIENDEKRLMDIQRKGFVVINGNGLDADVYLRIGLKEQDFVVVETGNDHLNVEICKLLRRDLQHERIISKSGDSEVEHLLRSLDVKILDATRVLALTIENLILRPGSYQTLIESFENYHIQDISVTNPAVDGIQVKDIPFHLDCTLVMINREKEKFIPHGNSYLKTGDIISVFGTGASLEDTRRKLGSQA